jgi:hypothetical protein
MTTHSDIKSQTCTAKFARLARWQATHKQLLCQDAQYRKRHFALIKTIVCLACLLLPFYLPFFGIRLFGFVANVSIISCLTAIIVYLALRQMRYQNQRVERYLQSSAEV